MSYTPEFVPNPVTGPNNMSAGWVYPNLTPASLQALVALFPQYIVGTTVKDPFTLSPGTPFKAGEPQQVLVYMNGATEPAYYVAQIFTHGFPFWLALQYALMEIQGTMASYTPGS